METATAKIVSFHGKEEVKEEYLKRLQLHYDQDEIIKGKYWEEGKGCAVGCTVHSSSHDAYQNELGISWRLAIIEDGIFEKLPNDQAKEFPLQFLKAIPVGVDTDIAYRRLMEWTLNDEKFGLIYITKDEKLKAIYIELLGLYQQMNEGKVVEQKVWFDIATRLRYASASASAYAYASAYASASASAYASASASASAYASAYASVSASASPEWNKEFDAAIIRLRDKLLQILSELK